MVEETANQPTNPADEEYEYEYIELAEGEELPEGAEYEYEYVEVPADEAAAVVSGNGADLSSGEKMTATAEADVPAVEISSDTGAEEDIPQFFREDAAQENAPVEPHVVYEPVSAADESGEIIEDLVLKSVCREKMPEKKFPSRILRRTQQQFLRRKKKRQRQFRLMMIF